MTIDDHVVPCSALLPPARRQIRCAAACLLPCAGRGYGHARFLLRYGCRIRLARTTCSRTDHKLDSGTGTNGRRYRLTPPAATHLVLVTLLGKPGLVSR